MTNRIKKCRLNLNTSESFRAWLAGLIDGEGNFYLTPHNTGPAIRIVLTESDKFVLDYILSTIGGKLNKRNCQKSWKPHWKPQWLWKVTSYIDCLEFTKWILPYLILKKKTAEEFLSKLEGRVQC